MLFTLNYHSIASTIEPPDQWKLSVSKQNFSDHLLYLKENFSILNPRNEPFSAAIIDSAIHFLITFDDGYHDILNALEVLVDHNLQALLFLAPAFVGEPDFWWHNLEETHWFESNRRSQVEHIITDSLDNDWRALHSYPFIMRQRITRVSKSLRSAADEYSHVLMNRKPISEHELRLIIKSRSFAFGSHTLTHAYLPSLSYEEAYCEILQGESSVTLITGMKSLAFAYPYGEYSRNTVKALKDLGIKFAFTIKPPLFGRFTKRANSLMLPRLVVEDWPVDEFSNRIKKCLSSR